MQRLVLFTVSRQNVAGVGGGGEGEDVVGLLALHCRAVSLLQNEITLENFVHKPKSHNNIVKHIESH